MKTIDTLIDDIHKVFQLPHEFDDERLARFERSMGAGIVRQINPRPVTERGTLRMSNLGTKCDRKLWYSVNTPNDGETLPVEARIKFAYGDILEQLLLFLAVEAGHSVEGTQTELNLAGIKGHRDAIIDGVLIDVKSASTYSFNKFKKHLKPEDDGFGYLTQLNSYYQASEDDPLITDHSRIGFLVIDKTLGHICLDLHQPSDEDYEDFAMHKTRMVDSPVVPPRGYRDEPMGKSGNMGLGTACSYCQFKRKCWPGVRTFLYGNGPEFLTKVVRVPAVQEAGF